MKSVIVLIVDEKMRLLIILLVIVVHVAKAAIPGTFFWKPRLALDLAIPTTESSASIRMPTRDNIRRGWVVLIDGYQAGVSVIALAAGLSSGQTYPHLSPVSAYFYTNTYRWALRYFSLVPFWLGGQGGHFCDTHKTWRRRFYYMDEFMPKWLRYLFPYVKEEEWEKEEWEMKRFKKYSEPAFGKHYRYPSKVFKNFQSQMTQDTVENLDSQNSAD